MTSATIRRISLYMAVVNAFYHFVRTKNNRDRISGTMARGMLQLPVGVTVDESDDTYNAITHYIRTIDRNMYNLLLSDYMAMYNATDDTNKANTLHLSRLRRHLGDLRELVRIEYYKYEKGVTINPIRIEKLFVDGMAYIERHNIDCERIVHAAYDIERYLTSIALNDSQSFSPYLYLYIEVVALRCVVSSLLELTVADYT